MIQCARLLTLAMAAVAVASMSIGASVAAAATDTSRPATCKQAWDAIAAEQAGLGSDDPAAWGRVSDAFISMSDASFDGPLSNALGAVSTSASDFATALNADTEGDPSKAGFNASLAALGSVCAKLTITSHKESVPQFQKFTYQSGALNGLSPDGGTRASTVIAAVIDRQAKAAKRANGSPCMSGSNRCAYYVQTLEQRKCLSRFVCVRSEAGLLPSGANSGQDWVDTFALDGLTGRQVALSRVVPATQQPAFLTSVNAAVKAKLASEGLANDPYWKPKVTMKDVRAWLPQPDGIHIWFDKYAVAPGYFGIVHVIVRWTSFTPNT